MSNLGLKALSVIIAALLCVFVNSDSNISSARILVPIEVRDLPPDKIIIWQLKKQVEVEVRGPSFLVSRVVATPPTLKIQLRQEVGAKYTAQINRHDLDIKLPLRVVSIEPSSITFTIESRVARELPIKVPYIGVLDPNLKIESMSVTPDHITATGPESEIRELQNVTTAPVDLNDVTKSYSGELVLRVPGKQTELSQPAVQIELQVSQVDVKRTFSELAVEVRTSSGEAVRVEPATVSIEVIGTKDKIDDLKQDQAIPYVRIPPNSSSDELIPVQVDLPTGVTANKVEPKAVKIIRNVSSKKVGKKG